MIIKNHISAVFSLRFPFHITSPIEMTDAHYPRVPLKHFCTSFPRRIARKYWFHIWAVKCFQNKALLLCYAMSKCSRIQTQGKPRCISIFLCFEYLFVYVKQFFYYYNSAHKVFGIFPVNRPWSFRCVRNYTNI